MTEEQRAALSAVLRTLDTVTVSGAQNMDKLLGCMQALHTLAQNHTDKEENDAGILL